MPGKYFSKVISAYPYYYNDSMSDYKLISSYPFLPQVKSGTPYYVLYGNDSLRYAVTILVKGSKYIVTHYDRDGAVLSIKRYNEDDHLPVGPYFEYFSDRKCKVCGKYKNGKEEGRWDYYDERAYYTYYEMYANGKVTHLEIFRDPLPNKFPLKHQAPVKLEYTLSPCKPGKR